MSAVNLSPRVAQAVQDRMAAGQFASEEELLLAALDALDLQASLDESIQASLLDEAAGRTKPVEGLAGRIRQRVQARRG